MCFTQKNPQNTKHITPWSLKSRLEDFLILSRWLRNSQKSTLSLIFFKGGLNSEGVFTWNLPYFRTFWWSSMYNSFEVLFGWTWFGHFAFNCSHTIYSDKWNYRNRYLYYICSNSLKAFYCQKLRCILITYFTKICEFHKVRSYLMYVSKTTSQFTTPYPRPIWKTIHWRLKHLKFYRFSQFVHKVSIWNFLSFTVCIFLQVAPIKMTQLILIWKNFVENWLGMSKHWKTINLQQMEFQNQLWLHGNSLLPKIYTYSFL